MNLFDLTGKNIVVTGGAGHLGKHICCGLADAGANVLCLSSKPWVWGYTDKITGVVCDVTDASSVRSCLSDIHSRSYVHGWVNCAVRSPRRAVWLDGRQFNDALNNILTHYFTCTSLAHEYMAEGSIVNFASMWGMISPTPEVYLDLKNEPSFAMSAAAGGILGLTRYMAVMLAKDNIRVNAIVPGWFPKKRGVDRPDYLAEISKRTPMGRIGQPEEIVGATIFLLSQASSFMTGQSLVVDGGYSIQ